MRAECEMCGEDIEVGQEICGPCSDRCDSGVITHVIEDYESEDNEDDD